MQPQGGAQQNPYMAAIHAGGGGQSQGMNPIVQAMQGGAQHPAGSPPTAGGSSPQIPGAPAGMQGAGLGAGGAAAAKAQMPSNTPGANPGSTDSLIKALGAMNQVITSTDDQAEIKIARQVILLLQQMVQMDQQKQAGRESALGQAQQGAQQFPPQNQIAPGGQPPMGSPMGGAQRPPQNLVGPTQ